jgi:ABC-type uncharacterized transport system substrate-binding protein
MDRRTFMSLVSGGLLAAPLAVEAQQVERGRVPRIGVTLTPTSGPGLQYARAFEEGLRDRGYVPNRNLMIEYRTSSDKPELTPEVIDELVRLNVAAHVLGATPLSFEVRRPEEFEGAFASMKREHIDGLVVLPDSFFFNHRTRIVELETRNRIPAMHDTREYVDATGFMSYGPSLADLWRRAAGYVDKILKGAKPGDLPVEQPTKFELVINLKTAKALRLTIPQSLLQRADEVIQ